MRTESSWSRIARLCTFVAVVFIASGVLAQGQSTECPDQSSGDAWRRPITQLISSSSLKKGDLLLCADLDSTISLLILAFESIQLGSAKYSHAAIYIGKESNVAYVYQMGKTSGTAKAEKITLDKLKSGATTVYAYRRTNISTTGGENVATKAKGYSCKYASYQISVLAAVGLGRSTATVTVLLLLADKYESGKTKMICSELAAWAYSDASWALTVKAWTSASKYGLDSTANRKMDYTTPNGIYKGGSLTSVGQLK